MKAGFFPYFTDGRLLGRLTILNVAPWQCGRRIWGFSRRQERHDSITDPDHHIDPELVGGIVHPPTAGATDTSYVIVIENLAGEPCTAERAELKPEVLRNVLWVRQSFARHTAPSFHGVSVG